LKVTNIVEDLQGYQKNMEIV